MNRWINSEGKLLICPCCGMRKFYHQPVMWEALIQEWELSPDQVAYIERQQGLRCRKCKSNLRSMALAHAILLTYNVDGLFKDFTNNPVAEELKILEINEAGDLNKYLKKLKNHTLVSYPEINMMDIVFDDETFDLVIHADTLEHIENPGKALDECLRILKPGGYCIFTVPIVLGRLTRSRAGMKPSFHGYGDQIGRSDYLVHTEFGVDVWEFVLRTGFSECRIIGLEFPAAQVLVGVKPLKPQGEIPQPKRWGIF